MRAERRSRMSLDLVCGVDPGRLRRHQRAHQDCRRIAAAPALVDQPVRASDREPSQRAPATVRQRGRSSCRTATSSAPRLGEIEPGVDLHEQWLGFLASERVTCRVGEVPHHFLDLKLLPDPINRRVGQHRLGRHDLDELAPQRGRETTVTDCRGVRATMSGIL